MILFDMSILESIEQGEIVIELFCFDCLGINFYDVYLGKILAIYKDYIFDVWWYNWIEYLEILEFGFVFYFNIFYLGVIEEYIEMYNFVFFLEGKFSVG